MTARSTTKKKKNPRSIKLSLLKGELKRVTEQLGSRERELAETKEQQSVTSEILAVIARSPNDLQPVFDAIVKNAAQLCGGLGASVVRYDGELVDLVAQYNISAEVHEFMQQRFPKPPTREFAIERAILATRHLARRQLVWLRADSDVRWIDTLESGAGAQIERAVAALCAGATTPY